MHTNITALVLSALVTQFADAAPVAFPLRDAKPATPKGSDETADIVVVGMTDQYKFNPKQIREALKAFKADRAQFAPSSKLFFQVWTSSPKTLADLRIILKSGTETIDLPLDQDLRFVIPDLPRDDWSLVSNKRRGRIVIVPVVMSPDTTDENRTLGDLRLQCRVNWAVSSGQVSFVVRGMFAAAGGCSGNKFAYYATANRPIASVVASDGRASKTLPIWRGNKYRVPVGDRELGNAARVRINPAAP